MSQDYDVIVVGSGPGGYVAAIRAHQLGLKTALIEKEALGGVCLNWGCIPTKSLLKSAELINKVKKGKDYGISFDNLNIDFNKIVSRSRQAADRMSKGVAYLVKHNKIDHIAGSGKLRDSNTVDVTVEGKVTNSVSAKHIVLATGARARAIPGLDFDGKHIISYREAMTLNDVPGSMVIVGGGAIGVEFAYFYASLGTDVTIVEMLPQLLPNEDEEIAKILTKSFEKQKIKVLTSGSVKSAKATAKGVEVVISKGDEENRMKVDKLLVAIGVKANTENIGLKEVGVILEKGFIKVDETYKTSVDSIRAIGDCIGGFQLAHVASAEAVNCIEVIAGKDAVPIDYSSIPACTYCQPQVASIGLTEKQALEQRYKIKIGRYPFRANGKSVAAGDTDGIVKLIFDAKYTDLLGAHIIGSDATEIIGELGIAKNLESTYLEIHKTVHAHPTVSEAIMEAAGDAFGEAIHI